MTPNPISCESATSHLTEYYLLMRVGGVVGGLFNAMISPMVFTSIAEYPIALVGACLLVPSYQNYFGSIRDNGTPPCELSKSILTA